MTGSQLGGERGNCSLLGGRQALVEAGHGIVDQGQGLLLLPGLDAARRMPDALDALIEAAVEAWDKGESELAREQLKRVVEAAAALGYL